MKVNRARTAQTDRYTNSQTQIHHHHHFILPTNKNTTFNNTTEIQLADGQKNVKFMKLASMLYTILLIYKHT